MKKEVIFSLIGFSVVAACLYCIPLFFFLRSDKFESIWLLYLGNILFGVAIALFMIFHIQYKKRGASTTSMVVAGTKVAATGIAISGIIAFILMFILVPGFLGSSNHIHLPVQNMVQDLNQNNNSLALTAYMNLVIGNIAAGTFASVMFAYTAKLNQTKDEESNLLMEEKPD